MVVGVDARHLDAGRGVARYLRETLRAWRKAFPGDDLRLVGGGRAVQVAAAARVAPSLERRAGPGLDAIWVPAPAPVRLDGSAPLVFTVHDLSWLERPRDFTAYERAWHAAIGFERLVRRAARIACVSAATRRALLELLPTVDAARVAVVHPGVARPVAALTAEGQRSALPPVVFVGALEPRKAPELLLGAHARARACGLRAPLVFAGDGRLRPRVAGRPGVSVLGAVDDERLAELYAGALCLAHPAWLEGFGLPPLEAALHGTPSVVADLPVYEETLGPQGSLRFRPGDQAALAALLCSMEADPSRRASVGQHAREQAATFSWERTARGIRALCAEAAS